jgi:hypothetical protein
MSELETWSHQAQAGSRAGNDGPVGDPDFTPAE